LGVCDYRRGMDLLTTCIHHSELHFTDHWHTQTSVLSLLQSPLAVSSQRLLPVEILQFPALRLSLHILPCWTQLSTDNPQLTGSQASSHFTPSYSSQVDFQLKWQLNSLTHQPATSRHFTQLNCWQLPPWTWLTLLITFRHEPLKKHRFHCYGPTIPRTVACVSTAAGTRLPSSYLAIAPVLLTYLPTVTNQQQISELELVKDCKPFCPHTSATLPGYERFSLKS
jgi:hypothetical protein